MDLQDIFQLAAEVHGNGSFTLNGESHHKACMGAVPCNIFLKTIILCMGQKRSDIFDRERFESAFKCNDTDEPIIPTTKIPEDIVIAKDGFSDTSFIERTESQPQFNIIHNRPIGFICDENGNKIIDIFGSILWMIDITEANNDLFFFGMQDSKGFTTLTRYICEEPNMVGGPIRKIKSAFLNVDAYDEYEMEEHDITRLWDFDLEATPYFPLFMHSYNKRNVARWRAMAKQYSQMLVNDIPMLLPWGNCEI